MTERYDLVLYGATGFTGVYVLEALAQLNDAQLRFAVAGRNEKKLRSVLKEVAGRISAPELLQTPVIIADSSKPESLVEMARQAKVIINVVGPYRLYGEAVVKAAVENGASHVDISGEPAFLERMIRDYGPVAEKNGVYIVGACGWDSIPCDLGVTYLKKHFDGTLSYAETFVKLNTGPSGYSFNAGTYQTLILGLWQAKNDGLGKIRKAIMPERLEKPKYRPPKRGTLWYNDALQSYVLPFHGSDRSVVQRSQYYDTTVNKQNNVPIEAYLLVTSKIWAYLLMLWIAVFAFLVQYGPTRRFLQQYPGLGSGWMFSENGPTRQQAKEATFTYWVLGKGWPAGADTQNQAPSVVKVSRCDGPDAGYIATAGCVLSAALTILQDKDKLPGNGGAFSTTAAFQDSGIYDRLAKFDITFRIDDTVKAEL